MPVLTRKILRDLWRMRGQVIAVALVVASGVALLIMSLSALNSLRTTTDAYYQRYGFGEVIAGLKRAPERLADRIAAIDGVAIVETRIGAFTTAEVPGVAEPLVVQLLSLPDHGPPRLNRLALTSGRLVEPGRDDEAVVLAPFARAHGLVVGDRLGVLLNGAKRQVKIVGLALSPEFVYALAPGAIMPDEARFGVVWMGRTALAAAYDLDGAFNSVSLTLARGTDPRAVIDRMDRLTDPYGGTGAIARANQISHWFLSNELEQLRTMATILPAVFLMAAAFLTNTFLARLIEVERREISLMKAFGYRNAEVGWHYAMMALAMAALGVLIGWAAGLALGRWNTEMYTAFFQFPFLTFNPGGAGFAISAGVSLAAALVGALTAVRRAVALHPAEAMRPPMPQGHGGSLLPETVTRRLDHPTRIILRQIARAPVRSVSTVVGVSLAVAILVMALQWRDGIQRLATSHFIESQHQNVTIGFFEPRPLSTRHALARLPGVLAVEPERAAPADFTVGLIRHRGALQGLPEGARLQVIHDVRGWNWPVPRGGVVLGTVLARKLGVGIGDRVTVHIRTGTRPTLHLPVTGLMETYIGTPAYVDLATLNRALGEGRVLETANLLIDPARRADLLRKLTELPGLASVTLRDNALRKLYETLGDTILIFSSMFVGFAGVLTMGVLYNAVRVALSERGRELATLRVLGFRRGEIAYILLGEAAILTLIALPLGCLGGWGMAWLIVQSFETELFRLPFVVGETAYANAVIAVLVSAVLAGLLVRRRLDRLDLIAVLKTRE
ncbi:MAG: ABC transporter permease [Alphaproteobacteria bacterium]|nr:ABC transporter permease [Alphaproteobacteria bacterium]MCB9929266.1 ABC transporter permease [Alphaproteobacteria bacterium]